MKQVMTSYVLGPHVGLIIEADGDETMFLNELINVVIDESTYEIDEDALEEEATRVEDELRRGLGAEKKSIGAFCYVNGIAEDELHEYCKANLVRTALENQAVDAIAYAEGITIGPQDVLAYKREYRDQYARTLLDEPDFSEDDLIAAIRARKVLNFLKENNMWKRKGLA